MAGRLWVGEAVSDTAMHALAAAVLFFVALLGGIAPLKLLAAVGNYEWYLSLGNVFAGSVFLTSGLGHMYNEAALELADHFRKEQSNAEVGMTIASSCCLCGFFLTLLVDLLWTAVSQVGGVDKASDSEHQSGTSCMPGSELTGSTTPGTAAAVTDPHPQPPFVPSPFVLLALLCVHSIMEGVAVGVVTQQGSVVALLVGIVPHKGLAGVALMVNFLKHGMPASTALKLLLLFATATPVGILLGSMIPTLVSSDGGSGGGGLTGSCLLALSSGTFLYVSVVEILVPELMGGGSRTHSHHYPGSVSRPSTFKATMGKVGVLLLGSVAMTLFQLRG